MNGILEELVRTILAVQFNAFECKHENWKQLQLRTKTSQLFPTHYYDVLEEILRVRLAMLLSVNKQLNPTVSQLYLSHHNDILEELLRVRLTVILNEKDCK